MQQEWTLDPEVTYLNHGSFGPSPRCVQQVQQTWRERMEANPQRFLARELEGEMACVADCLAEFLGCAGDDLILLDNATHGMNVVAQTIPLKAGDEVLVTTHEYGAVKRIWQLQTQAHQARMVQAMLPEPFTTPAALTAAVMNQVTPQTRLIIVSHVTSPTAMVLPVEEICRAANGRGIPVCIDGPHAIAMRELQLESLGCDFYLASCHKWLSAPFGTGFLYVHPRWRQALNPAIVSWGGSQTGRPKSWRDEFLWQGTRDLTGFLAIPTAIEFLRQYGLPLFRQTTHDLAREARTRLEEQFQTQAPIPDHLDWYGSMIAVPLPTSVLVPATWTGLPHPLQRLLAEKYRIEVPIIKWGHRMHIRVSCHLYNTTNDIDKLCTALQQEITT
jgi:isopenicillin-N epimerase